MEFGVDCQVTGGFTQPPHDNCLFLKHDHDEFVALLVYVDDILLTGGSECLLVPQPKYPYDILVDVSMVDARPASMPFSPGVKFTHDDGSLLPSLDKYRILVGHLLYLGFTRPDISFPVQQ
ncbi:UNVERIFIED_CONTAM: hypothetical protein Sradi_4412100, partial [Sesamum radiatum]